ncbi:hypothetical protein EDM54_24335 [Brevibacillus borstelensis]|uniref:hypothetical protein n=1 Tax=Brevibacillus borstelensis TaxID=45462 RepID=UPI000F097457|nr:hypothetical protein [Brevibacillus borstelensis]MED1882009.1 hypothetical protein [Brevibacillus borstelensis]RNB56121.1 hypothetical protein EDM54_24335 [Brevibacillus borstelensis]GED55555.1 hypothetical protein BBO01nite_47960 [Brevibacillus borstelensis]
MSKLEKYLAKAHEPVQRRTATVTIDGEEWSVRELTFSENRQAYKLAEDAQGRFDLFRYNDIRIVKATEHDFPWGNVELLRAYKAKDKFDMPVKLFEHNPAGYQALLEKVNEVNAKIKSEQEVVEDLKNSSEPTEKQATSVGHSSTDVEDQSIS